MITQFFETVFWQTATSLVELIVPVLSLFLVFRLIHDLLWR